jgi:predicted ester cyclase
MSEENKAILRRVTDEVFSQGNLDLVDELFAADYVLHDPGIPGGELRGPEDFKQRWVSMFRTAFPDLQLSVEDQVAEGDKVVTRYVGRGTHRGELMGIAPTGMEVSVGGSIISRVSGDRIEEEWNNFDALGMMQQLGAVPGPGPDDEPPAELRTRV